MTTEQFKKGTKLQNEIDELNRHILHLEGNREILKESFSLGFISNFNNLKLRTKLLPIITQEDYLNLYLSKAKAELESLKKQFEEL